MKSILLSALIFCSSTIIAQRSATYENGKAIYNGKTYAVGDTIQLGYGSNPNKSFSFVHIGSAIQGMSALNSAWSKYPATIEKVIKNGKTIGLKAKLVNKNVNALGGNKLWIDLEGAIDNKEII